MYRKKDNEIKKVKGLKWLPWIGNNYCTSLYKLMILGESHYLWEGEEDAYDILNDEGFTRALVYNNHQGHLDSVCHIIKPLDAIARTLLDKKDLTTQERITISNAYIYHVIVQKYLDSIKERPDYESYYQGWKINIEILKILKPNIVLAIGVESYEACVNYCTSVGLLKYNIKENIKINNTYPRIVKLTIANLDIDIIFLRHASRYYSWRKWHEYISLKIDTKKLITSILSSV